MSSKKHHHSSAETKGERVARSFLAFALALAVALLSLFCCIKFSFTSPKAVSGIFVNDKYVNALRADVTDFSHDICKASMLPEDVLDSEISYDAVYGIVNSYIKGSLGTSQEFTKTTYEDNLESLEAALTKKLNDEIDKNSLEVDKKQKNGAKEISSFIGDYLLERLQITHVSALETVINIGNIAGIIGMAVLAVIALVLTLLIISIGPKRYRAIRSVIHAVNAAALIDLSLIAGVQIVKHFKSLVLYPQYVADAFLTYVNRCEDAVGISSLVLFSISLILMAVVWKLNRDSKK